MNTAKKASVFLMILLLALAGCAGDTGDNNNGSGGSGEETPAPTPSPDPDPDPDPEPGPQPGDEITLKASINFPSGDDGRDENDFATVDDEHDIDFTGTIGLPNQLDVTEGNSGVGWAALEVASRKFCYQGNATDEETPDGTAYVLANEAEDASADCTSEGTENPDLAIEVTPDDVIGFGIESPGCSVEAESCQDTKATAIVTIETVESDS